MIPHRRRYAIAGEYAEFFSLSTRICPYNIWLGRQVAKVFYTKLIYAEWIDRRADVTICYGHFGQGNDRPNFQGTWNFVYYHLEGKLEGKYYTNRMDRIKDKQGSLGPAIFLRVSHEIITNADALEEGKIKLKTLEAQIMHRATVTTQA